MIESVHISEGIHDSMKLEDVLRSIDNDEPMGLEELRRAAAILREHVHTGTPGVLEARLRVATRLERLSR